MLQIKCVYKYILLILVAILLVIVILILSDIKIPVIRVNSSEKKQAISDLHNYKISVNYPDTIYNKLNSIIEKRMNSYIKTFRNDIKDAYVQQNQYYTLYITYKGYTYKNYLSYVFHIEYYTGGAHPNHEIWTVSFDTKLNKVITVDDLIKFNPNILDIFSNISRSELISNERIVDINMLMSGTEPKVKNFELFAFLEEGLVLFFQRYQIAPYSSGDFNIAIPYNKIY